MNGTGTTDPSEPMWRNRFLWTLAAAAPLVAFSSFGGDSGTYVRRRDGFAPSPGQVEAMDPGALISGAR